MKRKLHELQEKCRVKRQKVPTYVVETFTSANKLVDSVDTHMSMAKRAAHVNCVRRRRRGGGAELVGEPEIETDEQDVICKGLDDLTLDEGELRKSVDATK